MMHALETPQLSFIPAGPTPPNPAELVGSARMRETLDARCATSYDFVILDSPPVTAGDRRGRAGAREADGVRAGGEGARHAARARAARARPAGLQADAHLLGAVVNNVDLGWGDLYFYQPLLRLLSLRRRSSRRARHDAADRIACCGALQALVLGPAALPGRPPAARRWRAAWIVVMALLGRDAARAPARGDTRRRPARARWPRSSRSRSRRRAAAAGAGSSASRPPRCALYRDGAAGLARRRRLERRGGRSRSTPTPCGSSSARFGDRPRRLRRAGRLSVARRRRRTDRAGLRPHVPDAHRRRRRVALLGAGPGGGGQRQRPVVSDEPVSRGRASGPFVNPNHLAAWLEMVIPAGLAYTWSCSRAALAPAHRARRPTAAAASGVRARRAWVGALIAQPAPAAGRRSSPRPRSRSWWSRTSRPARAAARRRCSSVLGVAAGGILTARARPPRPIAGALGSGRASRSPLVLAGAASLGPLGARRRERRSTGVEEVDVSLASRLAVAAAGRGDRARSPAARHRPRLVAARVPPVPAPPIEGGIWDHAHNDYLELRGRDRPRRGGARRVLCARRRRACRCGGAARRRAGRTRPRERHDRSFGEQPDWQAALGDQRTLCVGAGRRRGGDPVHSLVEFGLHMPQAVAEVATRAPVMTAPTSPEAVARGSTS